MVDVLEPRLALKVRRDHVIIGVVVILSSRILWSRVIIVIVVCLAFTGEILRSFVLMGLTVLE